MTDPIIVPDTQNRVPGQSPIAATGRSFDIHEWSGSSPGYVHVHYSDDEAWHVLEGTLTFRLSDKEVEAPPGTTIFVPAIHTLQSIWKVGVEKKKHASVWR
jgi:mannose-6-phosphate isomerase-like protein (cupin superfamily)